MVGEAPELALSVAYWHKNNEWLTAIEIETIEAGIKAYINTYFNAEDAFATYKLTYASHQCVNTKVGALSEETKALNEGKGVGLIVGSGGNAVNEGNMGSEIIEHKKVSLDMIAGDRYVAICKENSIYRAIYTNYFLGQETA